MDSLQQKREEILRTMFGAVSSGDMKTFATCYHPEAKIWHNSDELYHEVEEMMPQLASLQDITAEFQYADQTVVWSGDEAFSEHKLSGTLLSGTSFAIPVLMRIKFSGDRIISLREYLDSHHTECFTEARAEHA